MPILTILAGPNGVGKTRYSPFLFGKNILSAVPVNIDLLKNEVIDQSVNDAYLDSKIGRRVDLLFRKMCEKAIKNKENFCFECYLRRDQLKYVKLFDDAGYKIELVYLYLHTIEKAKERVRYRYEKEEGNSVDDESIRVNFEEGLSILDGFFTNFDLIYILDNNEDNRNPLIKVIIEESKLVYMAKKFPPKELKKFFNNIMSLS